METILAIFGPFLYVSLLTGVFIYLFRKRYSFAFVLPLALIATVLSVFFFTLIFHSLTVAFWITVAAALGFIPLLILDKGRRTVLKKLFFTPGFVVFTLIYLFVAAISYFKVVPLLSDTSMHWAPHVWTMWLRDDFYTSPGLSIVIHGDYPPAIQLFEFLWLKAAGVFREGLMFIAIQMLAFSMLMPALEKLRWKKGKAMRTWWIIGIATATFISLPLLFFVSDFYSSLEVDAILAFIFAYGIYFAIQHAKRFSLTVVWQLSLIVTFLCLTKQVAIVLAALVIATYLGGLIITHWGTVRKRISTSFLSLRHHWRKQWPRVLLFTLALLLPLIAVKAWSAQIEGYKSPDKGVAVFSLDPADTLQIPSILLQESGSEAQQNFARGYIKHVVFDNGGFMLNIIGPLSYMQIAILFIGGLIIVGLLYRSRVDRKHLGLAGVFLALGWLGYLFVIYAVFLFGGMNDLELNTIDTPNRYIRTYLLALVLILGMLFVARLIDNHEANKRSRGPLYATIALILLFGVFFNKDTVEGLGVQSIKDHRDELTSLSMPATNQTLDSIAQHTGGSFENPVQILVTAQTDFERHYLQYNALPNRVTLLFPEDQSSNALCGKLKSADILIFGSVTYEELPAINQCLESPLTDSDTGSAYKVNKTGGTVTLQPLYQ